ncbi:hypothetical protein [Peribacillus alkalitolerans]|uniref:hypothetical protein n=1 Tax=Peribacillus alkalitolerans TaxID=1550385 RepID=UPI0013D83C76|nr:hypothetical protein [Peribacillus alkalitolerans]
MSSSDVQDVLVPTMPQDVANLVGLEVTSQAPYGRKRRLPTGARLVLVGLPQDVVASAFATGRGGF